MQVNNTPSPRASAGNAPEAPAARAAVPRVNLFANDTWFAADDDLPTVGAPVGNAGVVGGPVVGSDGTAPGGRVIGSHADGTISDGRGTVGGMFNRVFRGSGSGSSGGE